MSYVPCELHCHTVHSDGDFQVKELLQTAKADGLSLIALTDHNTTAGHASLDDSVLPAIRGIEWTTYFGHLLVLGAKDFVDWRTATPYNIEEKLRALRAAGGVTGIAHPYQIGAPICTGGRWEFQVQDYSLLDYVEILHEDMRKFSAENDRAPVFWTALLDRGYKLAAVYGRDWHRVTRGGHYGCTYLDIDGPVSEETALAALKAGRSVVSGGFLFTFSVTQNGTTYRLGDTAEEGEATLRFTADLLAREDKLDDEDIVFHAIKIISNGGDPVLTLPPDTAEATLTLERGRWYRAELWGTVDGVEKHLVITSPIYCEY